VQPGGGGQVITRWLARISPFLASPTAIRLGHCLYAWYLVHRAGPLLWLRLAGPPAGALVTALAWLVIAGGTLVVAGLCYQLWERPAERWLKHRFFATTGRRRAPKYGQTAGGSGTSHGPGQ
jgi:peptidoglycan/LPS O-acetylase OafA/YrhL